MASKATVRRGISPTFPFTLEVELRDGGVRKVGLQLSYDFNTAVLVEEKTGFNGLGGAIFKNLTATNLSVLLWAMVQSNHAEYDGEDGLDQIRSFINLRNSAKVSDAVQETFIRNLPDDQQAKIRTAIGGASPLESPTPSAA